MLLSLSLLLLLLLLLLGEIEAAGGDMAYGLRHAYLQALVLG